MRDDAFGGKVAERLEGVELPAGTAVFDFGTGGLDLAYEVMRGYDALLLVDVSRQGGEPGTLYVMDAEPDEVEPIGDGEVISPHGMDPQTVLRFVKTVGGWPGQGRRDRLRARRRSRRWDSACPPASRRRSAARSTSWSRRSASSRTTPPTSRGRSGRCMSSPSPPRSSTRRSPREPGARSPSSA